MLNYPLPGERIAASHRNVEFGHGQYDADEPMPEDLAGMFRALHLVYKVKEMCRCAFERRADWPSFEAWREVLARYDRQYNALLHAMHGHKYKTYVCDGFRIRLVTEPDGCRANRLDIEEIDE